jgi:hypothetical protein
MLATTNELLRQDMALLRREMSEALAPVNEKLDELISTLLVPKGEEMSRHCGVSIFIDQNHIGHGAVVSMKIDGDEGYYLLSAAHVLIDLVTGNNIILKAEGRDRFECQHAGKLYIHPAYVSTGHKDFGFLALQECKGIINVSIANVVWCNAVGVGKSVVAHGLVFLRGTVTSAIEHGRFSALAHSIPGQSGSVLFNNDKAVAGVVHGSSKHRGKHSAASVDDVAVVYFDSVEFSGLLLVTNPDHHRLLQYAELGPEDVVSGNKSIESEADGAEMDSHVHRLVDALELQESEPAWQDVMKALLDKIDSDGKRFTFNDARLVNWKTSNTLNSVE